MTECLKSLNVGLLLAACTKAVADPHYLKLRCGQSYRHPNGFDKLTVFAGPDWALRLHLWRSVPNPHLNDPHDHCGPFASRVLSGKLINVILQQVDAARGSKYVEYYDRLILAVHMLDVRAEVSLRVQREDISHAGTTYYMSGDEIHQTTVAEPLPCLTIVLQGPRHKEISRVFRPICRGEVEVGASCSPDYYLKTLREYSDYWNNPH